jgi:hypothetical protein
MDAQCKQLAIDDERCCYILQSSNKHEVGISANTITTRSQQTLAHSDILLAGLGSITLNIPNGESISTILDEDYKNNVCKACRNRRCVAITTPTILRLPPQYTLRVVEAIVGFVQRQSEAANYGTFSILFSHMTLPELYLLLTFADAHNATKLGSAVATYLLNDKGLKRCARPRHKYTQQQHPLATK